ncbi:MAG: AAA family ATPase [Candidatus Caenarcaniphilales bacterium]|jgi:predicted AAA+ superfamily ATPase|nr:AAA family ATPase [Candidatus Caenarcaniphilales bacterium]
MNYLRELKINPKKSFFLFGPRQVGKSTLLRNLFHPKESLYYNFLLNSEYMNHASDPNLFRNQVIHRHKNQKFIIVDEVQRLPSLLNEVHYLLEESKNPPIFCLSGSSARKLKKGEANLLAGRALTYKMFPLSHREIGEDFNLIQAISYGTLPAVYTNPDLAKETLRSYAETYIQEEIKAEALVRNLQGFVSFLKLAAIHNGEILNFANIARETGNSQPTIKEYFQILIDTLLGNFLMPYSKSFRRRLVAHPKFYFFDIGVKRALEQSLSLEIQSKTESFGRNFEHFLILEIIKYNHYYSLDLDLSFYRTNSGAEVDLIIQKPDSSLLAIEIKANEKPNLASVKGLWSFKELEPNARMICACLTTKRYQEKDVLFLPWQELFELL